MRLSIRHRTLYTYQPEAERVAMRLRLFPGTFVAQSVERWAVTVNDGRVEKLLTDGFGNGVGLWMHHAACDRAEIVAEGIIETEDEAGVVRGLNRRPPSPLFLRETPLTEPNARLRDLARSVDRDDKLDLLHALMHAVHAAVSYRTGVTTPRTTAAEALNLGVGVCQDHAHVFIAACRELGLPARYVTGYMLAAEPESDAAAGADENAGDDEATQPPSLAPSSDQLAMHAWAEAHVPSIGWIGFDPANAISPTDRYVRLCAGLDADAAAPVRGTIGGECEIAMTSEVAIAVLDSERVQRQTQGGSKSQAQTQAKAKP